MRRRTATILKEVRASNLLLIFLKVSRQSPLRKMNTVSTQSSEARIPSQAKWRAFSHYHPEHLSLLVPLSTGAPLHSNWIAFVAPPSLWESWRHLEFRQTSCELSLAMRAVQNWIDKIWSFLLQLWHRVKRDHLAALFLQIRTLHSEFNSLMATTKVSIPCCNLMKSNLEVAPYPKSADFRMLRENSLWK